MPLIQQRLNQSDIDAAGSYLERQLLMIIPKTYEKQYASLWAEDSPVIPVVGQLAGYERQVEAQLFEAFGKAAEYSDRSSDIPIVSSSIENDKYNVHIYAIAIEYGVLELKARAASNQNITSKQIMAANRALRQSVHELLCFGDANRDSFGLYNDPNITPITTTYDPNAATWQEHVSFFSDIMSDIRVNNVLTEGTRYIYVPDKLRTKLATTYQTNDSGKSALEAIMEGNSVAAGGTFEGFVSRNECQANLLEQFGIRPGGTGEDRILFLPLNEDAVNRVSGAPDVMPTQLVDMNYRTVYFYQTSETIIEHPDSLAYVDVPEIT